MTNDVAEHYSKKLENLRHAVAMHYVHYNFCRIHKSLRVTPAMEAGLTDHVWTLEELFSLLERKEAEVAAGRNSQIDRIRKAEEAIRELVQLATQIRQKAAKLSIEDPVLRKELLETAEGFEIQAQDLRNALREWREDIHGN